MINLGNKIRELRKEIGITQEQLASTLSVTPQAVSKWEMGVGFPDVSTLPVIAGFFKVSLDSLFDYDPEDVDEKIQSVLFKSRVDAKNFEECERILLDGIAAYPGGDILKLELLETYMGEVCNHGRTEYTEKALDIGKRLVAECKDSFIYLGAMGDMAKIYIDSGRYEDGNKIIESMPYRYPIDIYDRMRCTVMYLNSEDSLHEAREWKRWAHQELYMVCQSEGKCFFDTGDYENALYSYGEAADLIERFWQRPIPEEYSLLQDEHISRGFAVICKAACLYKLGRLDECDTEIEKAHHLVRDCYSDEAWQGWAKGVADGYKNLYARMGLDEYRSYPY